MGVYVCVYVIHYCSYHLPDFAFAICLGFAFFFSCFSVLALILFNAKTNHLWNSVPRSVLGEVLKENVNNQNCSNQQESHSKLMEKSNALQRRKVKRI